MEDCNRVHHPNTSALKVNKTQVTLLPPLSTADQLCDDMSVECLTAVLQTWTLKTKTVIGSQLSGSIMRRITWPMAMRN